MTKGDKVQPEAIDQKITIFIPCQDDQQKEENEPKAPRAFLDRSLNCFIQIRGYIFGLLFAFSMCMSNLLVKLAPSLDAPHHSTIRYIIQFTAMYIIIKKNKLDTFGPRKHRKLLILRGITGASADILGFFALQYLDISDVETLVNSAMIITVIISRFALSEKITIVHSFSLILTICGVLFVVRPDFVFGKERLITESVPKNLTNKLLSAEVLSIKEKELWDRNFYDTTIGISMALGNAISFSIVQVVIRKLCILNVHFSVTTIYLTIIGLITSIFLSGLMAVTNVSMLMKLDISYEHLLVEISYSILAGICGTLGIMFMNYALKYEDASKVAMIRTFSYLFLDVSVDILGILGALFIVLADSKSGLVQFMTFLWNLNLKTF
ncbi:solute carrier family 35 member G1 [Brachionus plicatilis]|uniref:Solute carrier family 35 member G1 n=1 Tax=Brachionus plicatilis TaxID=10195 RepID=A0A3M7S313_BRAPC|nr:solute carrier family 35 member G1 [Brachionus plicatilis]